MDNFGDLIDFVAGRVCFRGRRRYSPDSSFAGSRGDRLGIQSGLRPTLSLVRANGRKVRQT